MVEQKIEEKVLTKKDIFEKANKSLSLRYVNVPEWGGKVFYVPMTMKERREIRKKCSTVELDPMTGEQATTLDAELFEIWAIIYCCRDPRSPDHRIFDPGDVQFLSEKMAAGPISHVATEIMKASGMAPNALKRGEEGTLT